MTRPRDGAGPPIGEPLPGWVPRPPPPRTRLVGRTCVLEPLDAGRHAADLFAAYAEADAADWTYLPHDRSPDAEAFGAWIAERSASEDPLHMAIVRDGVAVGAAAFMRIDAGNGAIEIGHVHFAPALQRTVAGAEAIALMMGRAFDELGYRRLEWKCDSLNAPSRRAALRYGFTFEGIFRQAIVTKGRNRDTAWFAMIDRDWPAARDALARWLAPENFDAAGRQRSPLAIGDVKGGGA